MSVDQADIRRIAGVSAARRQMEGDGFEVRRALPSAGIDRIGPFIFLDHMGPVRLPAGSTQGFPEHPHAGIETLTYLVQGRMAHRDSIGNASVMRPGEAQWMRAGRGILHEETPDPSLLQEGGTLEGLQFWLDLPPEEKQVVPAYRQVNRDEISEVPLDGGSLRLIAGSYGRAKGPIETFGTPFLAHLTVKPGMRVRLDTPAEELAAYMFRGHAAFSGGQEAAEGFLLLFTGGEHIDIRAGDGVAELMLFGGDRMTSEMVRYGPFVTNSIEAMRATIAAFQRGEFGRLPRRA